MWLWCCWIGCMADLAVLLALWLGLGANFELNES